MKLLALLSCLAFAVVIPGCVTSTTPTTQPAVLTPSAYTTVETIVSSAETIVNEIAIEDPALATDIGLAEAAVNIAMSVWKSTLTPSTSTTLTATTLTPDQAEAAVHQKIAALEELSAKGRTATAAAKLKAP